MIHDTILSYKKGVKKMANIGVPSLILIIVIALIIFGPKKLPELGKATGSTLREFKKATNDLMSDDDSDEKDSQVNKSKDSE